MSEVGSDLPDFATYHSVHPETIPVWVGAGGVTVAQVDEVVALEEVDDAFEEVVNVFEEVVDAFEEEVVDVVREVVDVFAEEVVDIFREEEVADVIEEVELLIELEVLMLVESVLEDLMELDDNLIEEVAALLVVLVFRVEVEAATKLELLPEEDAELVLTVLDLLIVEVLAALTAALLVELEAELTTTLANSTPLDAYEELRLLKYVQVFPL